MSKDNIYSQVIAANDIVNVINQFIPLTKKGRSYVGLCPFHSDSTPSMSVAPDKQVFKCFSCGVGGNALTFVEKYKKISKFEALQYLASLHGIDVSQYNNYQPKEIYSPSAKEQIELLDKVNSFYKTEFIKHQFGLLNDFYNQRHLTNDILDHFDIGFSDEQDFNTMFADTIKTQADLFQQCSLINENGYSIYRNRVMFAIRDEHNSVVGFSGRTLIKDEKPKYINSAESEVFRKSNILYNYYNASNSANGKNELIITEGFFDVIALYKASITNAVGLMGTALTKNHFNLVKNKKIILFLDGDEAGQNATLKSAKFLLEYGIDVKIVINPTSLDPDELLNAHGPEYLQNLIKQAVSAIDFIYEHLLNKHNLIKNGFNDVGRLKDFIADFSTYIATSPLEVINYYQGKIKSELKYEVSFKPKATKLESHTFEDTQTMEIPVDNWYEPQPPKVETPKLRKKQEKENLQRRDWIDKLFYLILSFPGLSNLFLNKIQTQNDEDFDFTGMQNENTKKEIFTQIYAGQINNKTIEYYTEYFADSDFIRIKENISKAIERLPLNEAISATFEQFYEKAKDFNIKHNLDFATKKVKEINVPKEAEEQIYKQLNQKSHEFYNRSNRKYEKK
ncbi:DNA primase [Mycoplasmopsis iners]|uniref:DNA primase n=1 Tax=Mycoplasmopsis iners TaxID=76630 RepID=UPI0006915036|nr:DNA primase [Mycoplasmopsis iners]